MTRLEDFIDGNYLQIDGECKKLESWTHISDNYCARLGDCDLKLRLSFKDGSVKNLTRLFKLVIVVIINELYLVSCGSFIHRSVRLYYP